jgi:hypothetical protein
MNSKRRSAERNENKNEEMAHIILHIHLSTLETASIPYRGANFCQIRSRSDPDSDSGIII